LESVPVSLIVVLLMACWHYWESRIDGKKPEQVGKKGSADRRREQSTKEPS
jgi:hypothetical protein